MIPAMAFELTMVGGLLRISISGVVNWKMLQDVIQEVARIEEVVDEPPHRITDLGEVTTIDLDYGLVSNIANTRRQVQHSRSYRSAIVAPLPLHFGFARMYETMGESDQTIIRTFHTMEEAEAWIGEVWEPTADEVPEPESSDLPVGEDGSS